MNAKRGTTWGSWNIFQRAKDKEESVYRTGTSVHEFLGGLSVSKLLSSFTFCVKNQNL
jgi:hypothetical protein